MEIFSLTSTYTWDMGSRWYVPDIRVVAIDI
jgi:hypothetical protein